MNNPERSTQTTSQTLNSLLDSILEVPRSGGEEPPRDGPIPHPYRTEDEVRVPLELLNKEQRGIIEQRLQKEELRAHIRQVRVSTSPNKKRKIKICYCGDPRCKIGYFIEIEVPDTNG